jgi:hypothetical protein
VWPSAAICLIAAAISYTRITPESNVANDPILAITFQFVLYPLPLLPPMLAGFFAPRSTWLAGGLTAAISTLTLVGLLVATQFKMEGSGSIQGAGVFGTTVSWLSAAIPFGALMGAAAGWYKRFLDLMGSGRRRAPAKPSNPKRPVRRGQAARR